MKKEEEIFLNLAKLSEEEKKELSKTLSYKIDQIQDFPFLVFDGENYDQYGTNHYKLKNKTEVNLQDFKEIMGGEAEEEIPERHIAFETEYQLEEFRKIQSEYFDDEDKCYTGIRISGSIMERMLKLINQLHKELTTN